MENIKKPLDNKLSEIEYAIKSEENTIPYTPMTNLPSLKTVVPLALASETITAQFKFKEEVPDVIAYLLEKLKYKSKLELSNAILSEQADAVAMAIFQIEKNNGFILSDMAGIGKGRVNASILRYSYLNGYLPVFITVTSSLFSAMYRDIVDIGGFGMKDNQPYYGNPLILNGFENGGTEIIEDENGNKIKVKRPSPTSILDSDGREVIQAPSQEDIKKIVLSQELPSKYDYILLTYSQLSSKNSIDKLEFLKEVYKNKVFKVVMAMDEVHKASGNSTTGINIQNLLSICQGCLYSSATFSKRPENMHLYSLKTDIRKAPVSPQALIKSIKLGGEKLTEYLALNLVESQQMLRRERTFANCDVIYEYMRDNVKELYEKYDKTIELYNECVRFFSNRNKAFNEAKKKSIERFAKESKVVLAKEFTTEYENEKEWRKDNIGKYRVSRYTIGGINRSQFIFIETLLFALKSDFVSKIVIEQLKNKDLVNYTTDGLKEFKSNRKPVIAVRNTLQGVYDKLNIKVGDIIDKADFSMYILSIVQSAMFGTIELREILVEDKKSNEKKINSDLSLEKSDFEDEGKQLQELITKIKNIDLNIPLSPIDDLIDKIEATSRPNWDDVYNKSPNYIVGEVTGRTLRLKKLENGKYLLTTNTKDKSTSTAFKKFNSGIYDVLLINEKGSTGEDAHSSKKFKDQRPRVMIINQVELDVAIEVQKRGRINRTGMVNYPTYIYAVSSIPSEIRRLVMLANKLKSLDANTTGNQKQSAKLSEIQDSNGKPIQDIANEYGDELLKEFLGSSENSEYNDFAPTPQQWELSKMSGDNAITIFMRNLELANSELQLNFYNTINSQYINYIEQLKKEDNYNLETVVKDLKGQIINRLILYKGNNTSSFDRDVYIEDVMAYNVDKPLSKEEKNALIIKLANNEDPNTYLDNFIDDMKKYLNEVAIPNALDKISKPDYENQKTKEEIEEAKKDYEAKLEVEKEIKTEQYTQNIRYLTQFRADKKYLIPDDILEAKNLDNFNQVSRWNGAVFCGIKLLKGSKDKYMSGSIVLVFAQLRGKSVIEINLAKDGKHILALMLNKPLNIVDIQSIDAWQVDKSKRSLIRIISGDIITGYRFANDFVDEEKSPYNKNIKFLKFTTIEENETRLGLQLKFEGRYQKLDIKDHETFIKINNISFLNQIEKYPTNRYGFVNNGEESFQMSFRKNQSNTIRIIISLLMGNSKGKNVKYLLNSSKEGVVLDEINKYYSYRFTTKEFRPNNSSRNTSVPCVQFEVLSDEQGEWKNNLLKIFSLINQFDVFTVSLNNEDTENTIIDAPIINLEEKDETEQEEGVIYKYGLLLPYNAIKEKIDGFSKVIKVEVNEGRFGTAYLKSRANPQQCSAYNLMPLNVPPYYLIKDSFALLQDADKLNFSTNLKNAIEKDKSNYEIFTIIEEAMYGKVLRIENIFGQYAKNQATLVELYKSFYEGKIEEIKTQSQSDMEAEFEQEKIELNYSTIEDFVILFKTKIR